MPNIDFSQVITAEAKAAATGAAELARLTAVIDAWVEETARARSYNSAAHIASYVASTVPVWAAEAGAFVAWRDAVWLTAIALLDGARATGAVPTEAQIRNALPAMEWPAI